MIRRVLVCICCALMIVAGLVLMLWESPTHGAAGVSPDPVPTSAPPPVWRQRSLVKAQFIANLEPLSDSDAAIVALALAAVSERLAGSDKPSSAEIRATLLRTMPTGQEAPSRLAFHWKLAGRAGTARLEVDKPGIAPFAYVAEFDADRLVGIRSESGGTITSLDRFLPEAGAATAADAGASFPSIGLGDAQLSDAAGLFDGLKSGRVRVVGRSPSSNFTPLLILECGLEAVGWAGAESVTDGESVEDPERVVAPSTATGQHASEPLEDLPTTALIAIDVESKAVRWIRFFDRDSWLIRVYDAPEYESSASLSAAPSRFHVWDVLTNAHSYFAIEFVDIQGP